MIEALLREYPSLLPFVIVAFVAFSVGGSWMNFRYMRKSMVTKSDLTIEFLKLRNELNKTFVTVEDCDNSREQCTTLTKLKHSRERV